MYNGIVVRIIIIAKENFDIKKHKNEILEKLSNQFDIECYEIEEYPNAYELIIKKDLFENNIHEFIKEIDNLTPNNIFISNLFLDEEIDKDFNKENYKIKLTGKDKFRIKGKMDLKEERFFPQMQNLIFEDEFLRDNLEVYLYFIPVWRDPSKICSSHLYTLLLLLNYNIKNQFKNKLASTLKFYLY